MITINIDNLFKISPEHGLIEEEISAKKSLISKYLGKIEARKQGFYKTIDESTKKIQDFAQKVKGKYKHIVVLGIGGSALGAICLQQSLKHLFENELFISSTPKLYVIDNIDPLLITEIEDVIDYEKTLFIVISKSGDTIETFTQYKYFRANCEKKKLNPRGHFVFITDPKKGELRKIANKENIPTFDIPENVGGRFSVLTAVGLLPAALIDIDINKLIVGAASMRDKFLSTKDNPSFTLATVQYLLSQKGKTINVLMPYSQKLIKLTDWYEQLLAESIGKDEKGITPTNALGATDQHSQIQLYNDGPNDKLIIFLEVQRLGKDIKIPGSITFNELIKIEKEATAKSLTKNNRPNLTILVDSVSEETLGELFMFFEGAVAFLGEYFGVNAFDQPGVELGKKLINKHVA